MTVSGPDRRVIVVAALGAALALLALAIPDASARGRATASKAVTFSVQNVNRSRLACGTDGATYQVKGHLVGPRSAIASTSRRRKRARAATLYLHGFGFGEWFWRFAGPLSIPGGPATAEAIPGYDYSAELAKKGHTSVTIDRLGYDTSGHPDGNKSCIGGQADIAHQVIQALHKGNYAVDAGKAPRFRKVALAGHSAGAAIAMVEAYSFRDIDALVDMSFSFSNLPRAQVAFGPTRDACAAGGEPAESGLPSGYAYFGQPVATDFGAIMFHSSTIGDRVVQGRNRDPCGDASSIIPALLQQQANVRRIKVPTLVICGTKDALYSSLGCGQQRDRFTGSRQRKLELVRGAGHALTLERQAATFRRKVGRWLGRRGF